MSKDDIDMADASPEELRSTLKATLEVVQAQRAKLEELQGELSEVRRQLAEESAAAHRNEELRFEAEAALTHEKAAREATEETLRATSVDFARKLAAMQAKVMEAERDVVLGGQVIMVPLTSAPSSAAGSSSGVASAPATPQTWSSWAGGGGSPRSQMDSADLTRPSSGLRIISGPCGGSACPRPPPHGLPSTQRRARSSHQQRLDPLPPPTATSASASASAAGVSPSPSPSLFSLSSSS
eukprot:CAMPEP_0206548768 /NCGR_PEP_ID=MMETSP0325_2-20121206/14072_1 /ASSEMBLY_ACC=CAM_ASM_000347 /TAXON_ID=2866 /ORGANISM="Crypthecodinium cohnii, Strain Seligo" /LENGTH=239 /DNA_ID=CAMNT_0054048295 /DNA_START=194 /DNA_END=913 /DNA_ORIENTATION=-